MQIINKKLNFSKGLVDRPMTNYILIHHMAGNGSVEDIHRIHIGNGWAGIGYHFYVRKDGCVYEGRPINKTGSHVSNYNSQCLGVCFEGNYETEKLMPEAQKKAGRELIAYLKGIYPKALIRKHKDLNATACPGRYFPFDEIIDVNTSTDNVTSGTLANTKTCTVNVTLSQLSKGSEGKEVKTLQRLLISLGHSCGASGADGDFGNGTYKAVLDFQRVNGLSADGIVGTDTWNMLLK